MLRLWVMVIGLLIAAPAFAQQENDLDLSNTVYLDLTYGRVVIRLHPELAPNTVARFKELARQGFYDGLLWHRVIPGFMAQTGDPTGDGTGGSGVLLKAEFNSGRHMRGAVSMARGSGRNSADSQFFVVLANSPFLDGQYTYFGEVVSGMQFIDQIHKGDPSRDGAVTNPDRIVRLKVASDPDGMPKIKPAPVAPVENATPTALPTTSMAAAFDGGSFKCRAYASGLGDAGIAGMQTSLGHLWVEGYLAGYYKGKGHLAFSDDPADAVGLDALLAQKCEAFPDATIPGVALHFMAWETRPMPATAIANYKPSSYTCGQYVDGKAGDPATAEFASLWAFAFIQGSKNVAQASMAITPNNKPVLIDVIAKHCAANRDMLFVDMTALVADKVKLK